MSGTVYTVASGKGGVGKTTTSVNLAVALWQEGNAVGLVDADIGMANLAAVLNLEPEATLHDVLSGRATVEEALVEAQGGNLLVLPGDRSLESFADADPRKLRAAVDELAERCDYVIVDTGAGLSYEDVLPLGMAHGVLLVTTPDPAAFGDTRKTMEVADLLGAPIRGLVVTRAVADTDSEAIAGEIGAELLGTVPEDPAVMASTVAGNPLESHAPDSEAAAAYRDVAAALLAGDEEWLEAHPRQPIEPPIEDVGVAAEPDETPAYGETSADDETPDVDDSEADDEPSAEDDAADASEEAGEAWAAANEEPVGADDATDFGDIMVEPGEASEAEEGPEAPSAEEEGAGGTDGGAVARREGGTTTDDAETSGDAGAADDRTTDDTAPPGAPDEPWAASADDLEGEVGRDTGGSTASSTESDDAGTADVGVDDASDGADEDAPDEGPEGSADRETADPADRTTEEPADEEPDEAGAGDEAVEPGEEDGAAEDQEDEAADPGEEEGAGESDEGTADADEEEEAEEEETRGGFFGWLGRRF